MRNRESSRTASEKSRESWFHHALLYIFILKVHLKSPVFLKYIDGIIGFITGSFIPLEKILAVKLLKH